MRSMQINVRRGETSQICLSFVQETHVALLRTSHFPTFATAYSRYTQPTRLLMLIALLSLYVPLLSASVARAVFYFQPALRGCLRTELS